MTFSSRISFPSKVPEFLHVLFNLVEKHSPVSFLGLNVLVRLCCVHCACFRINIFPSFFSETKCKPAKKIQRECFATSSESTCKNSGTFEGKQILPEKVTYVPLTPSHSIYKLLVIKDYQKYQAKVLKLQEREKTPQNQAKLDAVMSFVF